MKKLVCVLIAISVFTFGLKVNALSVSAKAAIVINGETGEVIYEHNPHLQLPMASTTKIMTALLLCESGNLEREITVTDEMVRVEGTSMGLLPGDKVKLYDLLYGMLLASGNDAANTTAYVLGGNINGFVKLMNRKAEELGLENTRFETPSGLDGEEHYTTAYDLANLAKYALQNEEFSKAAASKSVTLQYGNPPYKRTLTNHNKLLKMYDGAVGVKTGFTKKSGRCLVSAARKNGKLAIAVTLNDPNDWQDHTNLLDLGLNSIETVEIVPKQTKYTIPVISSDTKELRVNIADFKINSVETTGFSYEIELPRFVYAPVKKGDIIGQAVYYKNGKEIKRTAINSEIEICIAKKKPVLKTKIKENFINIFKNIWEN